MLGIISKTTQCRYFPLSNNYNTPVCWGVLMEYTMWIKYVCPSLFVYRQNCFVSSSWAAQKILKIPQLWCWESSPLLIHTSSLLHKEPLWNVHKLMTSARWKVREKAEGTKVMYMSNWVTLGCTGTKEMFSLILLIMPPEVKTAEAQQDPWLPKRIPIDLMTEKRKRWTLAHIYVDLDFSSLFNCLSTIKKCSDVIFTKKLKREKKNAF